MFDSSKLVIKRYERRNPEHIEGQLVEIIEVQLPKGYDHDKLRGFLESPQAFEYTDSYFNLEQHYYHSEQGAGGRGVEVVLEIWNSLPPELRSGLISEALNIGLSLPKKIFQWIKKDKNSSAPNFTKKEIEKSEKERIKAEYDIKRNIITITKEVRKDKKVTIYKIN